MSNLYKELEAGFRGWLSKQFLPVEAAVVTATSAAQGATIGGFMGILTNDLSSSLPSPDPSPQTNPQAMASFKQAQVGLAPSSFFIGCLLNYFDFSYHLEMYLLL